MLEKILHISNVQHAVKRVISNGGACGVDGMQTDELRDYLNTHWPSLREEIMEGRYLPKAVKKVEIPKGDGSKRMLGIPTVIDRVIQQSIAQWLEGKYDSDFHEDSYGFRPKRNAHQAVLRGQEHLNSGYTWIVELDLEKFFDRVNHDKLMHLLGKKIEDKRTLLLIGKYLRSGIMSGGITESRSEGMPQGSPLSPLLSNIMLDELDKELASRGHRFVRYADDCSIYLRSEKSANRVKTSITRYLETTLKLKVNRQKSKTSKPFQSNLLGFSYYRSGNEWEIRVSGKSLKRIRDKIRMLTKRNHAYSLPRILSRLGQVMTGWVNYFSIAKAKSAMSELDSMTRRRLRVILWKQWKTTGNRLRQLIKLGVKSYLAYRHANTRKSYSRTGASAILQTTLTNSYFQKKGYLSFADYYYWKTTHQTKLF